jgi:transposase
MLASFGFVNNDPKERTNMSTSLLYHAFGLKGYEYVRTAYVQGQIHFTIRRPRERLRCPSCGTWHVHPRGSAERRFRDLSIGRRPVFIHYAIPRVECDHCGVIRQVKLDFAEPRRSYTRAFERYVLELSRAMTIQDVARHLGIGWDMVKDIQKDNLQRRFGRPKLRNLRQLAIDEISIAKGHRYVTVVLDLETGAVVFVGNGKGADALKPFWRRLRGSRAVIEAVAMDMSPAYHEAVSTHLPDAVIVYDHFHVIKLFNDKLSNLRRWLYHRVNDKQKKVLKGVRWLLLKIAENLEPERNEKARLKQALRLNKPLALAYYLKEDLRRFWEQPGKRYATLFLDGWIRRAKASGVSMLEQMAKTLDSHRDGLLAYYDYRITTGPLEGTNNKIKTMKRQAYGFRDHEFFKLKILGIHETKYALVG